MIRLLRRENNEIVLVTFHDGNIIPDYAILSHTWGPDSEEVKFEDLVERKGREKSGYKKLDFCANQAARDGLVYFWIDTCCINKTSSAELDEAIRSMFRWYEDSKVCYVYLSDVSTLENGNIDEAFANSRWHRRGWTLQELIAPKFVEFFSVDGQHLGNRDSRLQQLHKITGINVKALQGEALECFSITDRMSWTRERQTTRMEDVVYCLLGIFGVHIPIMYGEGKDNAMVRFREQVQRTSQTRSTIDISWIVPFERNPCFVGHELLLIQLEKRLFAKDYTSKIALSGLGGMGKTQLVIELLHRIKEKQQGCLIMWIAATSLESVHQGFLKIAQQLKIPGCGDKGVDVKSLVQEKLNSYTSGHWVLVFDNCDDMDMWISSSQSGSSQCTGNLIGFLPKNSHGSIIFTTRNRKVAVKLAQQNVVDMPGLDVAVATELLRKRLINHRLVRKDKDVARLLSELTYLPLAIVQAAAYINENDITLADYCALLADKEEEAINVLSEEFEDDGRYRDMKNPVAATWLVSFEQIRQRDPLAVEYLSFMACVNPKDIPRSILSPELSRSKQTAAIGTLLAFSFINKGQNDTFSLHRLVHLAMRNWLRKENSLKEWVNTVLRRLESTFPEDLEIDRKSWDLYLPHAQYALESNSVQEENEDRIELMKTYARCLFADGRFNEAEFLFKEILEFYRTRPDNSSGRAEMSWLVITYEEQGRWKEAEELAIQEVRQDEERLGPEHLDTLTSFSNLALIYGNHGKLEESEKLELQVLETRQRVLGPEHPDTLISMNSLAATYRLQYRYEEAQQLSTQATKLSIKVLGLAHPTTVEALSNMAMLFYNLGLYKQALELNLKVLELRKKRLLPSHPEILASLDNLASVYDGLRQFERAEVLGVQVLKLRTEVLGTDHPNTLTSMATVASIYGEQGRFTESEVLYRKTLNARSRLLGDEHFDTIQNLSELSKILKKMGRPLEAIELLHDSIQQSFETRGINHPHTREEMKTLAEWLTKCTKKAYRSHFKSLSCLLPETHGN